MKKKQTVKDFTIDEKILLLTGADAFSALDLPQKGLRAIQMTDGPNGVKTLDGDAVCFMNTCLMASAWDKEICYEMGKMIGQEANRCGKDLLLAPAMNIKRNPLAGRNFEYYSEDPYLTGCLAAEFIKGAQSEGVLTCAKHFACNNQEALRWTQNSVVDEDTLRNIYLKAFEIVVSSTDVDCIMASYNLLNGEYSCQNKHLLTDILRGEWEYKGVVMSDWCAVSNLVSSVQNGLDLEMPGNAHNSVQKIKAAYEQGVITEERIDESVERLLRLYEKRRENGENAEKSLDVEKLVKMTGEAFVLLKNDGSLPLKKTEKILLVGNAKSPRIQGGGCAKLKSNYLKTPYEEISKTATKYENIDGYNVADIVDKLEGYDKVLIFLSLPEDCDSEAFDRENLSFPIEQLKAVERISSLHKNVVVILQNGSAVELPFASSVNAMLETYYSGSYGGAALAKVLYGEISPSGRLAESVPMQYCDVPNKDDFGAKTNVYYKEGQFVGYRYYSTYGVKTRYPFGFGLSYADFRWTNVRFTQTDNYEFIIDMEIENISKTHDGKDVAQVYLKSRSTFEPKMQLIAFENVRLKKGEKKQIQIRLDKSAFERYQNGKKTLIEGEYSLCVAKDCENVVAENAFQFESKKTLIFNEQLLLGELLTSEKYRAVTLANMQEIINVWAYGEQTTENNFESDIFLRSSVYNMPMRAFTYFAAELFDDQKMYELLETLKKID